MLVKPFRGLRPRPDLASRIPSQPYDVLNSNEARRLVAGDPYSFLHVIKPEVDLDASIDVHDDRVYLGALTSFGSMRGQGWLMQDPKPAFYIYRLHRDDHVQTGILGAASVRDYNDGHIRKHEHIQPEKLADRVRLNDTISANPGPVILTHRGVPELDALIETLAARAPDTQFTAADGVEHILWVVDDEAACRSIETLFTKIPCTFVADGHHRTAAAAEVSRLRAARLTNGNGDEACHFFMAAHFPVDQLHILDYNRTVQDLNGLSDADFLARIEQAGFDLQRDHQARHPAQRGSFGMYLAGHWYLLTANRDMTTGGDVVDRMDISILTKRLLQPILGVGDPRRDERIRFVGGIRGMEELERRVDTAREAVAFALYPTSVEDMLQVADEDRVMPPKSTWFEPKLRSGLVVQLLDDDVPKVETSK